MLGTLAPTARHGAAQLWRFTWAQVLCCLFPGGIFVSLAPSKVLPLGPLPRYDFILLCCVLLQVGMLLTRLETRDELKVIVVFHVLGLALELFKTGAGSWAYPEFAYSKVNLGGSGVPLYSGFMYASVASYLCQAWRRFDLRLLHVPPHAFQWALAAGIYLNFFSHHWLPDLRWGLGAAVFAVYWKTRARFTVGSSGHQMPLPLAFGLIGFFVYVAENIATYFGAWQYPNQVSGWNLVHAAKISSWALLVIVSFIVVAGLKHQKAQRVDSEVSAWRPE